VSEQKKKAQKRIFSQSGHGIPSTLKNSVCKNSAKRSSSLTSGVKAVLAAATFSAHVVSGLTKRKIKNELNQNLKLPNLNVGEHGSGSTIKGLDKL
jgi:hypothetical protein